MIKYICDRCKSEFDRDELYIFKLESKGIFEYSTNYDLCKDCADELFDFLNGDDKNV